ncbi:MAG: hypothetical protein MHPSP_000619, partial [Paramarteilia canceri]
AALSISPLTRPISAVSSSVPAALQVSTSSSAAAYSSNFPQEKAAAELRETVLSSLVNYKSPILHVLQEKSFKFQTRRQLYETKNLSKKLKETITTSYNRIPDKNLSQALLLQLSSLRYILNILRRLQVNDPSTASYRYSLPKLMYAIEDHMNYLETALHYGYILNTINCDSQFTQTLKHFEDLSLLYYSQLAKKIAIVDPNLNSWTQPTSHIENFSKAVKYFVKSQNSLSKTASLKIPSITKEITSLSNKFLNNISMHEHLIPQLRIKCFRLDKKITPTWLQEHFEAVYSDKEVKDVKRQEGTLSPCDIVKYLDLLEHGSSDFERYYKTLQRNILASPLSSAYLHSCQNNKSIIKDLARNRNDLAQKYGFKDYHQYLLNKSPVKIFNFNLPHEKSLKSLEFWLLNIGKVNKSTISDFKYETNKYTTHLKEFDLRYIVNKIIANDMKSIKQSNSTFFTLKSVVHGFEKMLYPLLNLNINLSPLSLPKDIYSLDVTDRNSNLVIGSIILDLGYKNTKYLHQSRYSTRLISGRRGTDYKSLVCIIGSQCKRGKDSSQKLINYPMTFFQSMDLIAELSNAIELILNPSRTLNLSNIPLGSRNITASLFLNYLSLNSQSNFDQFFNKATLNDNKHLSNNLEKIKKTFGKALAAYKVLHFAETTHKALFDLRSHQSSTLDESESNATGKSSSFLFRNWNYCYPMVMDRKNRFYYSLSFTYANYFATTYYTNLVSEFAGFSLARRFELDRSLNDKRSSTRLLNSLHSLLSGSSPDYDLEMMKLVDNISQHKYFVHFSNTLKPST